ncbi:MAG TPA: hypothetical protein DEP42_02365 [Ruminococcaceae bacterium]|nr:hypothetical protein [Oscillospiraceae bacterium]
MIFSKTGKENTEKVLKTAIDAARTHHIETMVIASSLGETMKQLPPHDGLQIICVTHQFGFPKAGELEFPAETRKMLEAKGIHVLTATHVLSGLEVGLNKKYGGFFPPQIMADTLRMFGQGTKVCVEIAVMAMDAGLLPYGKPVVAVGGTGRGADTAMILTPAPTGEILNVRIHEMLCKPGLYE